MEHSYLTRLTGGCRILLANILGQVAMVIVAMLVNNVDICLDISKHRSPSHRDKKQHATKYMQLPKWD